MDTIHPAEPIGFKFACFELVPAMRLLARDGRAIKVGSRAFDLLIALVERAGQIVTKHELMTKVWSNVIVEDTNLRVHVSTLRRLLGDDGAECRFIVHVARRGYVFVAPLLVKTRNTLPPEAVARAAVRYEPLFARPYASEPLLNLMGFGEGSAIDLDRNLLRVAKAL